jgi:hypothetical protein
MASDRSVSEVTTATTTGNSSSKRLLDGECERKLADIENPSPDDSTTDVGLDVDNPAKRIKVEAFDGGATAEKNPLNPVETIDSTNDTNDSTSTSTGPPPSQAINCKDEKDKGDDGAAHVGSVDVDPADIDSTIDADIGVAASSQRGETTSESSPASSPAPSHAVTRFRCNSIDKKKDKEVGDAVQAEAGSSTAKGEPNARWRGKANFSRLKRKSTPFKNLMECTVCLRYF